MKALAVMFALGVLLMLVVLPDPQSYSFDSDHGGHIENGQPQGSRSLPALPLFGGVFWGAPFSFFRGIGVALVIMFWYTMLL
jgi:hypothetical protein